MTLAETIAEKLLQIKAIKLSPQSPFTWASGRKSPIYCDNRITLSYPEIRRLIIDGFAQLARTMEPFEVVGGVATAGIPHGALLAEKLNLPFIYVRNKPKAHGRQNQIEGALAPGRKVLLIEDLISTGGSSLQAVEAVRENGNPVAGVLAIFSYGFEEAESQFAAAGCPVATLSDYDTLIRLAEATNYVEPGDLLSLQEWRKAPQAWSENWQKQHGPL